MSAVRKLVVASLLCSSLAWGQTQEGVARVRFNKGRDLFMKKDFTSALAEFRAAAELYESPNTRLYIGRCERELGHAAAAYVELQRAGSEAADRAASDPRYASTQNAAKEESAALESKLGHVTIVAPNLPDEATVTLNGTELGSAALGVPAPVDPGSVEVVAQAPGYVTVHKTASVQAGDSVEVKVTLQKAAVAPPPSSSSDVPDKTPETPEEPPAHGHGVRNAGLVIGGLGLAGMGVFVAFGVMAQSRFSSLQSQCNNGPCPASDQSQLDEGQTWQTVANVSVAIGATLLTTGVVLLIVAAATGKSAPAAASAFVTPGGLALRF